MILGLAFGLIFGLAALFCFKILPSKWLCDYGEAVQDIHLPQNRKLPLFAAAICVVLCTVSSAFFGQTTASVFLQISFCITSAVLALITFCDIVYTIIPNELLIICAFAGAPVAFSLGQWYTPFIGAFVGGFVFFAIAFLSKTILKTDAMGMGDVVLAALCGFLTGVYGFIAVCITAIFSAAIVFSLLIILKKISRTDPQPFGPFLALGVIAFLAFLPAWENIALWYLGLL